MRLTNQHILGQGSITALAPIGRQNGLLVAAIGTRLQTFSGVRLYSKAQSKQVHTALITSLTADPSFDQDRPTHHLFASGGLDGRLVVWGVNSKDQPLAAGEIMLDVPVHELAWGPPTEPGKAGPIAAALQDGRIGLWWPGTDRLEFLEAGKDPVQGVDWFPDGQHLASAGEDGVLRVWDLPSGTQAKGGLLQHYNAISQVAVSACGRWVAYVSDDEKGSLYDLARRDASAFGEPGDPVVRIAWHRERPLLVAGSQNGRALLHDPTRAETAVCQNRVHLHPVTACGWSLKGALAYTAGRCGTAFASKRKDGDFKAIHTYEPFPKGYALSVRWRDEGQLVSGHSDGSVCRWEAKDDSLIPTSLPSAHERPVYGLDVSPDGTAVASGSVDKTVRVWDLKTQQQVHLLKEIHNKPIYGVSYSPDSRYLATGSGDTYLVIYDIVEKQKKAEEAFGQDEYWHFAVRNRILNCVAWSPTGGQIAVGLSNHTVVLLDVHQQGKVSKGPTLKAHQDSVSAVVWTPDARRLISVGYDRRIAIWDPSKPRLILDRVVEHEDPIQALAVHPDGQVIATGSWDATIRLWSTFDLGPLGTYREPHHSAVEDLDFDRLGQRLASASSDGTLGIWTVHPTNS